MTSKEIIGCDACCSDASFQSRETATPSSLTLNEKNQFEHLSTRRNRKPALTIATGRRPKNLVLVGEEAIKRAKRREKNREAARKLKEKREAVEGQLNEKIKQLQIEHVNLQSHLQELQSRRETLQKELDNCCTEQTDAFLGDQRDVSLVFEQYSDELDLFYEIVDDFDFD